MSANEGPISGSLREDNLLDYEALLKQGFLAFTSHETLNNEKLHLPTSDDESALSPNKPLPLTGQVSFPESECFLGWRRYNVSGGDVIPCSLLLFLPSLVSAPVIFLSLCPTGRARGQESGDSPVEQHN